MSSGTISVPFVGATENAIPEQIDCATSAIIGFGFTVTVMSKVPPIQPSAETLVTV